MKVICEHCALEFEYDAVYYDFEPVHCPDCQHINFVLDFD